MSSEAVNASAGAGKLRYLIITAVVIALDQITKYLVSIKMVEGDEIEVIRDFFAISYTKNPGIAFGMLNNGDVRWLLVAISVVAVLVVLYYMMRAPATNRLLLWSLALLAAGISGNLIDRVRIGRVIDFILVHYKDYQWPVFNVADTAITVGASLMAIELFLTPQADKATVADHDESPVVDIKNSEVRSQESE
ncbi:MAG TPA: signal peptidase II [Blastocatellia bacterium]|nr:signal peptidase II [Blastocatellia bacterium]